VTKVMAQMVESLRDDASMFAGGAAATLSRHFVERTRPVAVRPLASLAADAATTKVRWRHGLVGTLERAAERITLRLPDKTMTFPASCGDAVSALHRGQVADAGSLPGLDHADATVLVRRLLREAVVVPVDA
jgi:hypothetical protein